VNLELKGRLEKPLIEGLDEACGWGPATPDDVCIAMRRVARRSDDSIYEWLATSADWDQLVAFLAVEGGPDAVFDDLVALCQVGLRGAPKLTLGANYWDEMGRGDPAGVHTRSCTIDWSRRSRCRSSRVRTCPSPRCEGAR